MSTSMLCTVINPLFELPRDILREIVSFLGEEWALPFALSSKALLGVVREQSGGFLKTRTACFLQTTSLCVYGRDVMQINTKHLKVVNEAARYGLLEGVKWLKREYDASINLPTYLTLIGLWDHTTLTFAAQGGHLAVLQWIKSIDPSLPWGPVERFIEDGLCAAAARNGHLHVIQWARVQDPPAPWNESMCSSAASGAYIDIILWGRSQNPPAPWDERVCALGACGGHLHVIQWARAQNPPAPWDESTCHCAASENHLHVIQWARAQNPPAPWDERTCLRAAQHGYTEIVEWALAQKPPCPVDEWTRQWISNEYYLGKITLEDMKASWNRVKRGGADDENDDFDEENMIYPFTYDLVDRLQIARQYDPNTTLGYDSDEDTDDLRTAHQPCRQCRNGVCISVADIIIHYYCYWVFNNDGVGTCWPKWDIESCPFPLADDIVGASP